VFCLKRIQQKEGCHFFFVIAIIAGIFGFTGVEAGAASIAKTIFFVFVVLVVISFLLGVTIFKSK